MSNPIKHISSILELNQDILEILIKDSTTNKNLIWGTKNYESFGLGFKESDNLNLEFLQKKNETIIKPRIEKSKVEQKKRSKDMAEVFTPSWLCNKQNNIIDSEWFGYKNVFNIENEQSWISKEKVDFKDKSWKEYVDLERMEVTCGEAPYLCSRYDVVSGEYIKPSQRIGLLDRKLIVISENINLKSDWYEYAKLAFKRTYGYDYQGDNVLIARGNLLLTFIDYYAEKFSENPESNEIIEIAKIISWNIWQMDGIKYVVPLSCHKEEFVQLSIFEEFQNDADDCRGCFTGNIHQHNGIYSNIKDWRSNKKINFVDLIK